MCDQVITQGARRAEAGAKDIKLASRREQISIIRAEPSVFQLVITSWKASTIESLHITYAYMRNQLHQVTAEVHERFHNV